MAAASVYGACRCTGRPQTLDDVTNPARVEHSRVTNAYTTLNTELGLPAQPVRPSAFVPRLASELDVSDQIRQRARRLAEASESTGATTGVRPSGFAAACLYKAGREQGRWLTQSDVADVADVSVVTVRTHRDTLDELVV
jgi:transcription initiation factor TFIIB